MGLPFFVNCSFLIQRAIYFETAPFFMKLIKVRKSIDMSVIFQN